MMNVIHVKPNRFGNQYHGWDFDEPLFELNLIFRVVFLIFWNILPYLCSFTMCINTWFIIFGIKRRHDLKNTQGQSLYRLQFSASIWLLQVQYAFQMLYLSFSRCVQDGSSNDKFIFIDNGSIWNSLFQFMNCFAITWNISSTIKYLEVLIKDFDTIVVKRIKDINPTSCRQQSLSYTVVSYLSFSSCLGMVSCWDQSLFFIFI